MFENHDIASPYNAFPRDETSPGPDQRPGVVRSQRTKKRLAEERKKSPPPKNGDQPVKRPAD